jgi:hypothetical protein
MENQISSTLPSPFYPLAVARADQLDFPALSAGVLFFETPEQAWHPTEIGRTASHLSGLPLRRHC